MLHVERRGAVSLWTIDRPEAKNALNQAMFEALREAVEIAATDKTLRAVVLTSAGNVFVSGGDLRELRGRDSEEEAAAFSDLGYDLLKGIAELPCPVVCALPGHSIGGGTELMMACDLRVADARAKISLKQVRLAVTTAWGTTARLVQVLGPSAAARLLYTAQAVDAVEAKRIGLVDDVSEPGEAISTALAWADEIAQSSPIAVTSVKRILRAASQAVVETVRPLERELFVKTWSSADHHDAVEAYFDKGTVTWRDRP